MDLCKENKEVTFLNMKNRIFCCFTVVRLFVLIFLNKKTGHKKLYPVDLYLNNENYYFTPSFLRINSRTSRASSSLKF